MWFLQILMYWFMIRILARLGYLEGLAYLLLLFVAMPLKYWFGLDWVLPILMALFLMALPGYLVLLIMAFIRKELPGWAVIFGLVGAVLPFGPFVFDQIVIEPKRLTDATKP